MKLTEIIELKSCPFCNGRAKINHIKKYSVECESCHARTGLYDHLRVAIWAWNRRTYNRFPVGTCIDLIME